MFGPNHINGMPVPTLLRAGSVASAGGGDEYVGTLAINFDGVNESGDLLGAPRETFWDAVDLSGGTISFWFKSADVFSSTNNRHHYLWGGNNVVFPIAQGTFISCQNDAGVNRIVVYRADIDISTSTVTTWSHVKSASAVTLADNTWHHLAVGIRPFMGSWQTTVYLNGAKHTMTTITPPNAPSTLNPGGNLNLDWSACRYSTQYSEFSLNEVGVWISYLTAAQIGEIYGKGVSGFDLTSDTGNYTVSGDLFSWHKMGEDTVGATEPDSSGNGRDMTLLNTPTIEPI